MATGDNQFPIYLTETIGGKAVKFELKGIWDGKCQLFLMGTNFDDLKSIDEPIQTLATLIQKLMNVKFQRQMIKAT